MFNRVVIKGGGNMLTEKLIVIPPRILLLTILNCSTKPEVVLSFKFSFKI